MQDFTERSSYPYTPDFENTVILKQRKELQLLVVELKERDRELNKMAAMHKKQLSNCEADRKRAMQMEEKLRRTEAELLDRTGQMKTLILKLEEFQRAHEEKVEQCGQYLQRVENLQEDHEKQRCAIESLQEKNYEQDRQIRNLQAVLGQRELQEVDLNSELHSKDTEYASLAEKLQELYNHCRTLEARCQEQESASSEHRRLLHESNAHAMELRRENDKLRGEISKLAQDGRESIALNERLEKECLQIKKDLQMAQETERRQNEIIQSQRLKQERTDNELAQQRYTYERLQKDMASLYSSLESSREMLAAQHEAIENESQMGGDEFTSHQINNRMFSLNSAPHHYQHSAEHIVSNLKHSQNIASRSTSSAHRTKRRPPIVPAPTRNGFRSNADAGSAATPISSIAFENVRLHRVNSLPDLTPREELSNGYRDRVPDSYDELDQLLQQSTRAETHNQVYCKSQPHYQPRSKMQQHQRQPDHAQLSTKSLLRPSTVNGTDYIMHQPTINSHGY